MITIVWDVDDVLNDLMRQWFTHGWLRDHPECRIRYEELAGNPPHRVLGITREEYLATLDSFRKTANGRNLEPNAELLSWFRNHGDRLRHIALTARPLETAPDVAAWVMRHFGVWIRCFGFVPSRAATPVPVYDRSKGEYLKWLGCGDVLVDDSAENIADASALGLKALLYPQPWNNSALTVDALLKELSSMAGEF